MRFRLILVPEEGGSSKVLRLGGSRLVGLGVLLVMGLAGLAALPWALAFGARLLHLQRENRRLAQELSRREAALDSLGVLLGDLLESESRLRVALGLRAEPRSLAQVPVGGYDIPSDWRLERLLALARLERDAYRELDSVLAAKVELAREVPSGVPCPGFISSGFGYRRDPVWGGWEFHKGVDIVAPRGTPVRAPADGVVVFAGRRGGYGLCVELDHGHGITTFYGHASRLNVKTGTRVRRGDVICYVGSTGKSTGPHLHYEIRVRGKPVDPTLFMGEEAASR